MPAERNGPRKEQFPRTPYPGDGLILGQNFAMALSVSQKLRIKEGMNLLTFNAPADFMASLEPLPKGVAFSAKSSRYHQIHWFVQTRAQMEKQWEKIYSLLGEDITCWIYYPKGTSGIQTDLSRDKGWDNLLQCKDLQWLGLISFDDIWSSFGVRLQKTSAKPKDSKQKVRPILEYIDAATKTVWPPDDLKQAMKKNKKAKTFFDQLSFTNQKEWVEWVVTAKQPETRLRRIAATVEKLEKQWKNPRNL
jgi:hypothetical protein